MALKHTVGKVSLARQAGYLSFYNMSGHIREAEKENGLNGPGLEGIMGLVIFTVHSLVMCLWSQFVIDLSQGIYKIYRLVCTIYLYSVCKRNSIVEYSFWSLIVTLIMR